MHAEPLREEQVRVSVVKPTLHVTPQEVAFANIDSELMRLAMPREIEFKLVHTNQGDLSSKLVCILGSNTLIQATKSCVNLVVELDQIKLTCNQKASSHETKLVPPNKTCTLEYPLQFYKPIFKRHPHSNI